MGNETPPLPGETPPVEPPPGETPTTPGPGETPGTTPLAPEETARELERLRASLTRANKEAKEHRERAEELGKFKAEIEASKLSDAERLQKQLATLQAEKEQAILQAQELRISSAIQLHAIQAGIDPTLARKLIDPAELDYGEGGNPTNVPDLLKALIKQYPALDPKLSGRAPAPTSGGATNPSRAQSGAPPEITREYISTLTAEDYARLPRETQLRIAQINYDQPWKRH